MPRKEVVGANNGWVRSASKETPWCGFCWSKPQIKTCPHQSILFTALEQYLRRYVTVRGAVSDLFVKKKSKEQLPD